MNKPPAVCPTQFIGKRTAQGRFQLEASVGPSRNGVLRTKLVVHVDRNAKEGTLPVIESWAAEQGGEVKVNTWRELDGRVTVRIPIRDAINIKARGEVHFRELWSILRVHLPEPARLEFR